MKNLSNTFRPFSVLCCVALATIVEGQSLETIYESIAVKDFAKASSVADQLYSADRSDPELIVAKSFLDATQWFEQDVKATAIDVGFDAERSTSFFSLADEPGNSNEPTANVILPAKTPSSTDSAAQIQFYSFLAGEAGQPLYLYNTTDAPQTVRLYYRIGVNTEGLDSWGSGVWVFTAFAEASRLNTSLYGDQNQSGEEYYSWYGMLQEDSNGSYYDQSISAGGVIVVRPPYDFSKSEYFIAPVATVGQIGVDLAALSNSGILLGNGQTEVILYQAGFVEDLEDLANYLPHGLQPVVDGGFNRIVNPEGDQLSLFADELYSVQGNVLKAPEISLQYNGSKAQFINFKLYMAREIVLSASGWSGTADIGQNSAEISINGREFGEYRGWGIVTPDERWYGWGVLPNNEFPIYLEPGDIITVRYELSEFDTDNFYYYDPVSNSHQYGLPAEATINPEQIAISIGSPEMGQFSEVAIDQWVPEFSDGANVQTVADLVFDEEQGDLGALIDEIIATLENFPTNGSVDLRPEYTGFALPIRIDYRDAVMCRAILKAFKGFQLLAAMQNTSVELSVEKYLAYLDDSSFLPFWEDHPELLKLVQSRSGNGLRAKDLLEQAIRLYESVESGLWSRSSDISFDYLFEIGTATPEERAEFAISLKAFKDSMSGPVPLSLLDPELSPGQSLSLTPVLTASPVNMRDVLPSFNENGVYAASSADFLASDFINGVSNLEWDQLLGDAVYIAAPESLVGKILLEKSDRLPFDGYGVLFFQSDSEFTFISNYQLSVHGYTWNAADAILSDFSIYNGQDKLEFKTGVTGTYELFSLGGWWADSGNFILYDGSWDLDGDGRSDAEQIAAGDVLQFDGDPFTLFYDDWDGDGLSDAQEVLVHANPQLLDTDSDGIDDWYEVTQDRTDPNDANSVRQWLNSFSPEAYLVRYIDLANAFGTDYNAAWEHYLNDGVSEGRSHSESFSIDDYLLLNPDVAAAFGSDKKAALEHWFNYGINEGRQAFVPLVTWPSGFSPEDYLARYADLAAAFGADYNKAWEHYLNYGVTEGRTHNVSFSIDDYLSLNGDLAAAFGSDKKAALEHWFNSGINEGRQAFVPLVTWPSGFSPEDYLARYADLAAAFGADYNKAWEHYLNDGVTEGRTHSVSFSIDDYLSLNGDLAAAFGSDKKAALEHWFNYGINEGRQALVSWPSGFTPQDYLARYNDLAVAFGADYNKAWEHYLNVGVTEGRTHSVSFSVDDYLSLNGDLEAAFSGDKKAALEHWFNYGIQEGRQALLP